jgi:transcriptional regulator with XRE-family HTH domain
MLTEFGRYLRKLRIDHGELIKDMAEKLGVTASYVSAVETGKRNIPANWVDTIAELYNLDFIQKQEFADAASRSAQAVTLHIENVSDRQKDIAVSFAREFGSLDDETISKIHDLLNKGGKKT